MRVSDLPPQAKRELASHVRVQIGSDQYDAAVRAMGEDTFLDALLERAAEHPKESKGSWVGWLAILVVWVLISFAAMGPAGPLLLLMQWLGPPLLQLLWDWLVQAFRYMGKLSTFLAGAARMAGILVIIGFVGAGAWTGVPWVWKGMMLWWGWLGSHF